MIRKLMAFSRQEDILFQKNGCSDDLIKFRSWLVDCFYTKENLPDIEWIQLAFISNVCKLKQVLHSFISFDYFLLLEEMLSLSECKL